MSSKTVAGPARKSTEGPTSPSKKSLLSEKPKITSPTKPQTVQKLNNNEPMNQTVKTEKPTTMETEKSESKEIEKNIETVELKSDVPELKHSETQEGKSEPLKIEESKIKTVFENATTQTESAVKYKMTPIIKQSEGHPPSKVAVPRRNPPLSIPLLNERPLVVATHLVPSLPIELFEVLVEAIEVATGKPAVLLYEPRNDRPVSKDVTDIAILPADQEWEQGVLLPASFCFEHRLNKDNSPSIYADVVVAADRAMHVQDITDLRGHRCSLPDRKRSIGVAALLFHHLYSRGESPAFFGNTLDASTHVATLQMVAGKQAELGILDSPVIKCHKNSLPGVESVCTLTSLGPLPPYRIMVNNSLPDALVRKITAYLLCIDQDKEWMERFTPFGVTGFAENTAKLYEFTDMKSVATSVPYY